MRQASPRFRRRLRPWSLPSCSKRPRTSICSSTAWESPMQADPAAALTILTYVVRAMLVMPPAQKKRLVGEAAQPWAELLDRLSRRMRLELVPVVVPLLAELCKNLDQMTDSQEKTVGASARRMLGFGWDQTERATGLI